MDWSCVSGSVKTQGKCGSCYAFAPLSAISAIHAIYSYEFYLPFSVQEIIDCENSLNIDGCRGGFLENTYSYVQSQGINP